MQNPQKDSKPSPKSPSSSSPPPPPPPPPPPDTTQTVTGDVAAAEQGGSSMGDVASSEIARILQAVDPTPASGGGSPVLWGEAGGGEGGSYALAPAAVSVEGGGVVVASTVLPEKQGNKQKRKSSQVSDPPPWPPKCSECGKEFPSWKAAFGHMRAHPERDYRGFFRPPTSSSSPRQRVRLEENINTGVEQGGGEKGGSSAAVAATGGVGFDLNQPLTEEVVEASDSEAEAAQRNQALQYSSSSSAVRRSDQEENKVGFDLNQLPASEDDHDQHKP